MEISRRLFIFLVSTVIGFMLALVVAVGILVVRGPAGQLHAAHAVTPETEDLFEDEEEEAENRLGEIEGDPEPTPAVGDDEVAEEDDSGETEKLGSLSPEARALFEKRVEGDVVASEGDEPAGAEEAEAPEEVEAAEEAAVAPVDEVEPAEPAIEPEQAIEEAEAAVEPEAAARVVEDPPEVPAPAPAEAVAEPTEVATPQPAAAPAVVPAPGDADGDGVPDSSDKCVNEPEDKDGFESLDGCPDPDNDKDGVLDAQDKCPFEKESLNGYEDGDGCPDEKPAAKEAVAPVPAVQPAAASAPTPEPTPEGKTWSVHFGHMRWALDRSAKRIAKRSVRSAKRGKAVYIRGQSDAGGRAAVNRWYANKRAKAVRRYLVAKGVPASRIEIMDAVIIDSEAVARDKSSRRVDIIVVK